MASIHKQENRIVCSRSRHAEIFNRRNKYLRIKILEQRRYRAKYPFMDGPTHHLNPASGVVKIGLAQVVNFRLSFRIPYKPPPRYRQSGDSGFYTLKAQDYVILGHNLLKL
jgi:hypothetical protein